MTLMPTIAFARPTTPKKGSVVVLSAEEGGLSEPARACDPANVLNRAISVAAFKGKAGTRFELITPQGTSYDRLVVLGVGKDSALSEHSWLRTGGAIYGALRKSAEITVILELPSRAASGEDAANVALGILLRAYSFEKYKTKKDDSDDKPSAKSAKITIQCSSPAAARKAFASLVPVAEGVCLARDLVNEPANILGPVEFASRVLDLQSLGVKVDVLSEREMKKLGMGALLGVAQGSARPPRLVVMQWSGGKSNDKPIAFIGKGVTFDTGGNSIKPASGMEDMKGDMGGAAAVVGLIHALAGRKARVNAVGVIGCVENNVDGNAQRPGDIVTSMSGQTIEVLNTDAEGRLVLCDALWYCNEKFRPKFMIDLATLTGAIMVALGHHHAGLFSNNDELAMHLFTAGQATQERVWRMPLGPDYDKLLDSKNADMKNIGGRYAGAITAAQFLQRFVKDTPWAHIDIAGTGMGVPANEINPSWASGFGVRLLDRFVRDYYET